MSRTTILIYRSPLAFNNGLQIHLWSMPKKRLGTEKRRDF